MFVPVAGESADGRDELLTGTGPQGAPGRSRTCRCARTRSCTWRFTSTGCWARSHLVRERRIVTAVSSARAGVTALVAAANAHLSPRSAAFGLALPLGAAEQLDHLGGARRCHESFHGVADYSTGSHVAVLHDCHGSCLSEELVNPRSQVNLYKPQRHRRFSSTLASVTAICLPHAVGDPIGIIHFPLSPSLELAAGSARVPCHSITWIVTKL